MLHNVVDVWPGSYNNVTPGHAHFLDFQYSTCPNRVAKRTQHAALNNVAICCAEML